MLLTNTSTIGRTALLAKIHNCTLTAANLDYVGSISIDQSLLNAAGILPFEQVQVVNLTNGSRLITYAISAPADSGAIELNGAAARLGMKGDRVIIMTFAQFTEKELKTHSPTVVLVDEQNHLMEVRRYDELLAKSELPSFSLELDGYEQEKMHCSGEQSTKWESLKPVRS